MDQIVEDPVKKEAEIKKIRRDFILKNLENYPSEKQRFNDLVKQATSGKTVWYSNELDAEIVELLGEGKWLIEKDEYDKIKYKRTAIIVIKDPDGYYLIVQGNTWSDVPNNRPVIDFKIGDNKELIKIHKKRENQPQYMIPNNKYGFVKGSIEKNEDGLIAARRELHEETGLVLPYSSFRDVEYFSTNKDPRVNPVFTVNVTEKQRDAISTELTKRNNSDEGEIFSHHWAPITNLKYTLNSNSKTVRDRIMSKRVARGGKTRRSIRSKRRRTHKNYTK